MDKDVADIKKPIYKRWWFWGIILFIIAATIGGFTINGQNEKKAQEKEEQKQKEKSAQENQNQGYVYHDPVMTAAQLNAANTALSAGISIDDPANDFAKVPEAPKGLDGKNDNTKPYQLDWNDVKKVTIGADDQNLYVRYDLRGIIPNRMVTIDGDDIKGIGCNLGLSKFLDTNNRINEGMFQVGLSFTEQRGKDSKDESLGYDVITPRIGLTSIASPTEEQDKYGETVYSKSSSDGAVSGGVGKDYIIALFPLANLDIQPESEITFDVSVETNSFIYHHSSIDPLLDFGSAKSGKLIHYKLGLNTYTTTIPDYK